MILALQRTAGNAATAALLAARHAVLARDHDAGTIESPRPAGVQVRPRVDVPAPRLGDPADMDRAIHQYFENEDWESAAGVLSRFSQAEIDDRMRGYRRAWRVGLIGAANAAGVDPDRIWPAAQLENAIEDLRWENAARALAAYADATRIERRLRALAADELARVLQQAQRLALPIARAVAAAAAAHAGELAQQAHQAVARGDYDSAAILLNPLADGDLDAQLAGRTPPQLFELWLAATRQAVPRIVAALGLESRAGLIKTEGLDRRLREEVERSAFGDATATLLRLNDDDQRRAALDGLELSGLAALTLHLRARGSAAPAPVLLLRVVIETVFAVRRDREYAAAVSTANWARVVWLLDLYDDAELLDKGHALQRLGGPELVEVLGGAASVAPGRDRRVGRLFAYLPLEPRAGAAIRPPRSSQVTPGPPVGTPVSVPGGTVEVYDQGVDDRHDGWFGFDYRGADAPNTGWLQFVAREAEAYDAAGKSLGFETHEVTSVKGQGEERHWGTPSAPAWTIDTVSDTAPFPEAATEKAHDGAPAHASAPHDTSPRRTAFYDRPDLRPDVARAAFAELRDAQGHAPDHVILRLRLHDYLVRGIAVLYENTMTVEIRWDGKDDPAPSRQNTAGQGRTTDRLQRAHYEALIRRFPAWTIYPHD